MKIDRGMAVLDGDAAKALSGVNDGLRRTIAGVIDDLRAAMAAGWTEIEVEADTEWDCGVLRVSLSRPATEAELSEEAGRLAAEASQVEARERREYERLRRKYGQP